MSDLHPGQRSAAHLSDEMLSALIDGGPSASEDFASSAAHLQTCPACRERLAMLQTTVQALRTVPAPALPRSFILSPVQVQPAPTTPPARQPAWRNQVRGWVASVQPALRLATVAVLALLVMVTTTDLLRNSTSEQDFPQAMDTRSEPAAKAPAVVGESEGPQTVDDGETATDAAETASQADSAQNADSAAEIPTLAETREERAGPDRSNWHVLQLTLMSVLALLVVILLMLDRRRNRGTESGAPPL